MEDKQLYEKIGNEYKEFVPIADILSIIDKSTGMSAKDLFNTFNHIKLEWKGDVTNTRLSVPIQLRHNGLYITYNNGNGIITEYYIGSSMNAAANSVWQKDEYWLNTSQAAGLADEEDITERNSKLSFKDREYKPSNFSGLGKVILRKNLTEVGTSVKNVLTQDMISKENTIYVIQYDFILSMNITMPSNCVLKFDGGSISASDNNNTITFNNTYIDAGYCKIFNNVKYNGKVINPINVLWFGAIGDGKTNNNNAFALALRTNMEFEHNTRNIVFVPSGLYIITETLYLPKGWHLKGEGCGNTDLRGSGDASKWMIRLGYMSESVQCPGGDGPIVSDIFISSNSGMNGIRAEIAGYIIRNCWFMCNVGIKASGVDGIIDGCVSDDSYVFIQLESNWGTSYDPIENTHSITISNCITYSCKYCSILAVSGNSYLITGCAFYYGKDAEIIITSGTISGLCVSNCNFRATYSDDPAKKRTHISMVNGGKIRDSIFSNCIFDIARDLCINLTNGSNNIMFDSCMFANNEGKAINIENAELITISNCHFIGTVEYAITASSPSRDIKINGCVFGNKDNTPVSGKGISSDAYNFTLANNTFKYFTDLPIQVRNKSIIVNNIFWNVNIDNAEVKFNTCIEVRNIGASGSVIRDNTCFSDALVVTYYNAVDNVFSYNNLSVNGAADVYFYGTQTKKTVNERLFG